MGIGAIVGGALSLGGALIGGHSANKAATKAANTSQAVANQNNALARDIYGQNKAILSPYVQSGYAANNALNSFLGLPAGGGGQSLPTAQGAMQVPANALLEAKPWLSSPNGGPAYMQFQDAMQAVGQPTAQGSSVAPTSFNPQDAFRNYIANSDYGFQFGEGANKVNSGYAGAGTLQSGAAMKALEDYRQNLQSGYRNEFLGYLGQQQSAGLSAGSALAGVGNNYVANVSANNNSAGTAAANAILARGANNPFANALGGAGGYLLGRYG